MYYIINVVNYLMPYPVTGNQRYQQFDVIEDQEADPGALYPGLVPAARTYGSKPNKPGFNPAIKVVLSIALLVLTFFAAVYFNNKYQSSRIDPGQVQGMAQAEIDNVIQQVGLLVELPQGEIPTTLTITDITAFKDQAFFAKAQTGDKVLAYLKAKKVYLYRPSINQIIEAGPDYDSQKP